MRLFLVLLTFIETLESSATEPQAGFDWGEGCPKGVGVPFEVDLQKGFAAVVGIIPKGKFDVWVQMEAEGDLDIQLRDVDGNQSIVKYAVCTNETACQAGILGNNNDEMNATYVSLDGSSVKIGYSGYNGINDNPGNEWIRLYGETIVDMEVLGWAFESGVGYIQYSWGHTQTPCCLGVGACGGSFLRDISSDKGQFGEISDVGEIPPNVRDLYVNLKSNVDIDLQLYDLSNVDRWEEGRAIIGWCPITPSLVCNIGWLNGDKKEFMGYPEMPGNETRNYYYSGYNGVSGVGEEYIRIEGFTNRPLRLAAFAFQTGVANVTYSYYQPLYKGEEDPTQGGPARCLGEQEYSLQFQYAWNEGTHPTAYPVRPAWSLVLATAHSLGYNMWTTEFYASDGLKALANTGSIDELRAEASRSRSVFRSTLLEELLEGVGQRTGSITVNAQHSLLSAAVKLRPSPDWFTGARNVELCQDGQWTDRVSLPLKLYDAGTNSGTSYADRGGPGDATVEAVDQHSGPPFTAYPFEVPRYGEFIITKKSSSSVRRARRSRRQNG